MVDVPWQLATIFVLLGSAGTVVCLALSTQAFIQYRRDNDYAALLFSFLFCIVGICNAVMVSLFVT